MQGKGFKGGSFPLWIRIKERMGDPIEMLPKTRLKTAHFAKECAMKLAYRETFTTDQLWKEESSKLILKIILGKVQEENKSGLLVARRIRSASPSNKKLLQPEEIANLVAIRTAKALPRRASPLESLWVTAETMKLEDSLITAAATLTKEPLTVTSKLPL